jgi:hypothetical protein
MESKKLGVKDALMAAAAALASAVRPGRVVPIVRDGHKRVPGAFGHGKQGHNPAGTKLAKKRGMLTCRHPVGTHGRVY